MTSLSPRRRELRRSRIVAHHRYTGPSAKVRRIVRERAQGGCEWPGCGRVGTDYHHRLNRKQGGRKGLRAEEINQASWIVLACRDHHDDVTSPTGERRELAMDMGWLLLEHETASEVPVAMDGGSYYLDDDGGKTAVESQTPPREAS